MTNLTVLIIAAVVGFVVVATIILLLTRYKKCKPNELLIVYGKIGKDKGPGKCIHGGGCFVWPVIQGYTIVSMESFNLDVKLENGLSKQNIKVNLPVNVTLAVSNDEKVMQNAAVRLGSLMQGDRDSQLKEIIIGQLRQVVATMSIEELINDRDKLQSESKKAIAQPLSLLGIDIINITISDITDDANYIKNLGKKAAQEAASKAEVEIAEQVKKGEVGVAEQEKEKAVRTSEIKRDQNTEVAQNEQQEATKVADAERTKEINLRTIAKDKAVKLREQEKDEAVQVAEQERDEASTVAETRKQQEINVATAKSEQQQKVAEQERLRDVEVTKQKTESELAQAALEAKKEAETA